MSERFQQFALHIATAFPETGAEYEFKVADWDRDGKPDLIGIQKANTGSGTTEIHILSGASNFQTWLLHTRTAFPSSPSNVAFAVGDLDKDGKLDLFAVKKSGTGSHTTEVHVMSGASTYQTFILQMGSGLGETSSESDFVLGDYDRDGKPDLINVKKTQTGSGHTEVHILSGASNYQTFLLHAATPLAKRRPRAFRSRPPTGLARAGRSFGRSRGPGREATAPRSIASGSPRAPA